MRISVMIAASAFAFAAVPASAATNIVTNGSFEAPVTGSFVTNPSGTGWTVNNVDFVSNSYVPYGAGFAFAGSQVVDLVGNGTTGSLSQSISTLAGQIYNFSFRYRGNNITGVANAQTVTATISGLTTVFTTGVLSAPDTPSTTSSWQLFSGSFEGTGSPLTLTFVGTGAGNQGAALDDVQISAAPEPASWLMMILGFGLVGGALRRRRGAGTLAAA